MQGQIKGNDCLKTMVQKDAAFRSKKKRGNGNENANPIYAGTCIAPLPLPVIFPSLSLSLSFSAVFLDFVYHVNAMHLFFSPPILLISCSCLPVVLEHTLQERFMTPLCFNRGVSWCGRCWQAWPWMKPQEQEAPR